MDSKDFYDDLRNLVMLRAANDGAYMSDAFMSEVADRLVEAEAVSSLDVLNFSGTGRRRRKLAVNSYSFDDGDESIVLGVLHYSGLDEPAVLPGAAALESLRSLQSFLEESLDGTFTEDREPSTPEFQLAVDIQSKRKTVTRYRLLLVTDSVLSDRARTVEATELGGVPVEFHIWDISRLHQVHGSVQGREELDIDVREWMPAGLPALKVTDSAGGLTTYLAAVPGAIVAELYARHGSRLLEGNVRSYLSMRGRTNQGIRRTILNEPSHFLAYNNGISATATRAETIDGNIIRLRDLQIVNGGQTTASLFYANRDVKITDLRDVYVQMKLVVVDPAQANDMIPLISRFANSQNTVSEADFFSNHPFHVRMEELSKKVLAPAKPGVNFQTKWYYERTRGQHQNERNKRTPAESRKFEAQFPKSQLITKTDAAKYEVSWGQAPHQVSSGAQKNFRAHADLVAKAFNSAPEKFNETYFKELVAKAILFQTIRTAIAKSDWYESGQYLANLTTYALAKLSLEIEKQPRAQGFSLLSVWEKQAAPQVVIDEAVSIARLVLSVLTDPARTTSNVTEWAKKKQCWDQVAGRHWALSEEFIGDSIKVPVNARGTKRVTVTERFSTELSASSHVRSIESEQWLAVMRFLREAGLLTSSDRRTLQLVTGGHTGVLDRNEAIGLLTLWVKAENAGFEAA